MDDRQTRRKATGNHGGSSAEGNLSKETETGLFLQPKSLGNAVVSTPGAYNGQNILYYSQKLIYRLFVYPVRAFLIECCAVGCGRCSEECEK